MNKNNLGKNFYQVSYLEDGKSMPKSRKERSPLSAIRFINSIGAAGGKLLNIIRGSKQISVADLEEKCKDK